MLVKKRQDKSKPKRYIYPWLLNSNKADENVIEQYLWTAQKMLPENHGWILEMEYHLLFLYSKKLKTMKFWKKPTQLRMVQLGLHLLDVSFLKSIKEKH